MKITATLNTLNYKSPGQKTPIRWLKRWVISVPTIVTCYFLLVWLIYLWDYYVCHPYMLHVTNPLPRAVVLVYRFDSIIEPVLAFPAFFIFHNDGGIQQLCFFAINALFWGVSITSMWHGAIVIRNRRMGMA
jgi:hypothetical protein